MKTSRPTFRIALLSAALLIGGVGASFADDHEASLVKDLQNDFAAVTDKMAQLADAIPADMFSWRPSVGIRSVSESMMHVAAANYFFPTLMGGSLPEGVNPRTFEQEFTSKEDATRVFKESVDHLKAAMAEAAKGPMDGEISFAGQTMTKPGFLHFAISHSHEHLGQMIAYARSIGVVPPWSQ